MGIFDKFRLDGRKALITGGSRGLGRAMAQAFAEAGADLILVGRDSASLQQAQAELAHNQRHVDIIVTDMSNPSEVERMCDLVLARHSPLDILVNNVGGRRINVATENLSLEDWQRLIDLNLTSLFICTKQIGGAMVKRRYGRIINMASIAGQIAMKGIHGRHYEAAKAAVVGFTKAVAVDWAPYSVTVNAICPGPFLTEPNLRWYREKPGYEDDVRSLIPMRRLGTPDEIGPLALYLASDASSFMTGAVLTIDGGLTLW
jgi:gluconate 5-dehydrogenase